MPAEILIGNLDDLDNAIGICLRERHIWPALALLYAGIDVVASLEGNAAQGTRASFTAWAERYMEPVRELGCTGLELYGARCGLFHACSAESDLSRQGKVRNILYAWGKARAATLRGLAAKKLKEPVVVVHVDDLRKAFRNGLLAWWSEVSRDAARFARIECSVGTWFTNIDRQLVEKVAAKDAAAV